ncbi:5-formyltetrahydrofolate cyclo-ligase [Slackia heliotrinireducens]|uniref:5-formyltetrahydrofolate cyclo-ligase n=1 Tax=Slackia heliotrinireducens TaxID=84110 RepID=UPI00331515DA
MMDDIASKKNELRRKLRALRNDLGEDGRAAIDAVVATNVCEHPAYQQADAVYAYLSVGAEVDTRAIIRDAWAKGKLVAVPRCVPNTSLMDWYRIDDFEGLETSSFGIEEPPANPDRLVDLPAEGAQAVALVPAFSFDPDRFRLGYGGGFYDEFLPNFHGVSIGLCRACQMSDVPLPRREGDIAVDVVITD